TVRALIALDYPHDTWVLDEADHDRVRELCNSLGVQHFSRKHLPHYQAETGLFQARSKHGNYNSWLYEMGFDRYDIIAAFDADHASVSSSRMAGRVCPHDPCQRPGTGGLARLSRSTTKMGTVGFGS